MAVRIQIMCINKTNRSIAHERIHSIGGKNPGGTRWKRSQEQAIADIETRTYEYYVTAGGRTAKVVVAKSPLGHKYLKTVADGLQPDNLLSLDECPPL